MRDLKPYTVFFLGLLAWGAQPSVSEGQTNTHTIMIGGDGYANGVYEYLYNHQSSFSDLNLIGRTVTSSIAVWRNAGEYTLTEVPQFQAGHTITVLYSAGLGELHTGRLTATTSTITTTSTTTVRDNIQTGLNTYFGQSLQGRPDVSVVLFSLPYPNAELDRDVDRLRSYFRLPITQAQINIQMVDFFTSEVEGAFARYALGKANVTVQSLWESLQSTPSDTEGSPATQMQSIFHPNDGGFSIIAHRLLPPAPTSAPNIQINCETDPITLSAGGTGTGRHAWYSASVNNGTTTFGALLGSGSSLPIADSGVLQTFVLLYQAENSPYITSAQATVAQSHCPPVLDPDAGVDGGTGDAGEEDAGTPEEDAGAPEEDAGMPSEDGGTGEGEDAGTQPEEDAGTPDEDASTPDDDASTPDDDGGTGEDDAGDAGTPDEDASTPEEDAGTQPEEDAGTQPEEDAGTTPEEDAGTQPEEDAGTSPNPPGQDGGDQTSFTSLKIESGCSATHATAGGAAGDFLPLLGLLLTGLWCRRNRG